MTIYSAYNIQYSSKLKHVSTAIFAENWGGGLYLY